MKGARDPLFRVSLDRPYTGDDSPVYIELSFNHPRIFFASHAYLPYGISKDRCLEYQVEEARQRFLQMIDRELGHQIKQLLKVNAVSESESSTPAN